MSALATILLDAAGGLAVPVIKKSLGERFGGATGELAGKVIEVIAEKAGVEPERLPTLPDTVLETAIVQAEPEAAEILVQHVESQRLMNETMKAEMEQGGPLWTWAWRPFWMWLLAMIWTYGLILRPLANAAFGWTIEALDLGTLMGLTTIYVALYMGGHTVKAVADKWNARP